jgi:hypothetical protein
VGNYRSHRWYLSDCWEGNRVNAIKIQANEVRGKVKAFTVSMKNELRVSRGDSKVEAVFELVVVVNSKNIAFVVFPRECEMFN